MELTIPSEARARAAGVWIRICAVLRVHAHSVWESTWFGCMRVGLSEHMLFQPVYVVTQFQQLKFPSGTSTVARSWFNCPSRPLRYSLFYYFARPRHWTWPVCVRTILFFLLLGRLGSGPASRPHIFPSHAWGFCTN